MMPTSTSPLSGVGATAKPSYYEQIASLVRASTDKPPPDVSKTDAGVDPRYMFDPRISDAFVWRAEITSVRDSTGVWILKPERRAEAVQLIAERAVSMGWASTDRSPSTRELMQEVTRDKEPSVCNAATGSCR